MEKGAPSLLNLPSIPASPNKVDINNMLMPQAKTDATISFFDRVTYLSSSPTKPSGDTLQLLRQMSAESIPEEKLNPSEILFQNIASSPKSSSTDEGLFKSPTTAVDKLLDATFSLQPDVNRILGMSIKEEEKEIVQEKQEKEIVDSPIDQKLYESTWTIDALSKSIANSEWVDPSTRAWMNPKRKWRLMFVEQLKKDPSMQHLLSEHDKDLYLSLTGNFFKKHRKSIHSLRDFTTDAVSMRKMQF